jgi:hypothetical protein
MTCGRRSGLMTAASMPPTTVGLDDYLTDGRRLFRVIDVVQDQAALLEDAYDGQVTWQSLEELASVSLRRIVPRQFDLIGDGSSSTRSGGRASGVDS